VGLASGRACRGGRCVAGASGGDGRAWRARWVARSGVVPATGGGADGCAAGGPEGITLDGADIGVATAGGPAGTTLDGGGPDGRDRDEGVGSTTAARDGTGGESGRAVRDCADAAPGTIQIGVVATSTTAASTPRGRWRAGAGGGPAGRLATGGGAGLRVGER
jgi:hypothetical protein